MKYKSIPELLEKTHNELLSIANSEFNLGLSKKFTKKEVSAMIMAAQNTGRYDNKAFEVLRGDSAKNPEREELPSGYCILRINRSRTNPNGHPIPIGLQAKVSLAPVGVNFKAPEWILEILNNAIFEDIQKDRDLESEDTVLVHQYPFTVIKHNPSDKWAEIQAKSDRTMSQLAGEL